MCRHRNGPRLALRIISTTQLPTADGQNGECNSNNPTLRIQPFTGAEKQLMTIESFIGLPRSWVTDLAHGELTYSWQITVLDNDLPLIKAFISIRAPQLVSTPDE
jgi:hypothetical protein